MFAARFGGKKAFVITAYHNILCRFGVYRSYAHPTWNEIDRLVFVCMGNINRSAYAEYKAKQLGLESTSFGLDADESKGASDSALKNAAARGLDLSPHQCKSILGYKPGKGDLVLTMEPKQLHQVLNQHQIGGCDVSMLGLWANTPTPYLQDPIGRQDAYFQSCFERIDQAIVAIESLLRPR